MSVKLDEVKNLKIVPNNYKSSTFCKIDSISENEVKVNLFKIADNELEDYTINDKVEIFGLNKNGLIYFETEIVNKDNKDLIIKYPLEIKEIQRRKYTRVPFDGKLTVSDYGDIVIIPHDISAGGLKFTTNKPFIVGSEYDIKIELSNKLIINCTMQPIRVEEVEKVEEELFLISVKFRKIRSIDRIALMQYSLRIVSQIENKI